MMCGHAKECMASSWMGELDPAAESKFKQHLETCAECSAEMAELGAMWERLADLPAPDPSHALQVRWQSTMESLVSQRSAARGANAWKFSLAALWPQRPVWQATIVAGCLVAGL